MRDKILEFVTRRGPVLVTDISKEFRIDSMFAGAYLSDLVKSQKIKISNTKVGSSPLYYTEGQEASLEGFSKYLDEKDQKAYEFLKDKKVIWDKELNPLMQVAMRKIKDFAVPLRVNKTEIFWKYYTHSQEEAIETIKKMLAGAQKAEAEVKKVEEVKEDLQEKVDEKKEEKSEEVKNKPEEKRVEEGKDKKESKEKEESESKEDDEALKTLIKKEIEKEKKKLEEQYKAKLEEEKKALIERHGKQEKLEAKEIEDEFFTKIKDHLGSQNINILSFDIRKKNKEIEMMLEVPTGLGSMSYFALAKNKKKSNDKDLSEVYDKAREKGLPSLFLHVGSLTKKAESMIGKDFVNLHISKLE